MLQVFGYIVYKFDIIIQTMNVYECNGTNIFMRWKMKCSIQRGEAELNGTFHLSPNENICSIARMRNIHYLFYITCTKVQIPKQNWFNRKSIENDFSSTNKTFDKQRVQLFAGSITPTLASRLRHELRLLHLPRVEFRTSSFLLVSS